MGQGTETETAEALEIRKESCTPRLCGYERHASEACAMLKSESSVQHGRLPKSGKCDGMADVSYGQRGIWPHDALSHPVGQKALACNGSPVGVAEDTQEERTSEGSVESAQTGERTSGSGAPQGHQQDRDLAGPWKGPDGPGGTAEQCYAGDANNRCDVGQPVSDLSPSLKRDSSKYKVKRVKGSPSGYEIFMVVAGFTVEDIKISCLDVGRLLVRGKLGDEGTAELWGIEPLHEEIDLGRRVSATSARAVMTLHGLLYIRVNDE
eukprot:evm.model.scf_580EXC.5 EVM.evm.TU.scf_580EXC.5   scf_580EXC:29932-32479(+)